MHGTPGVQGLSCARTSPWLYGTFPDSNFSQNSHVHCRLSFTGNLMALLLQSLFCVQLLSLIQYRLNTNGCFFYKIVLSIPVIPDSPEWACS